MCVSNDIIWQSFGPLPFHRHLLSYARSEFNLKKRTTTYAPTKTHNLSNYYHYYIFKSHTLFSDDSKFQVIPVTDEKESSLSVGVKCQFSGLEKNVCKYPKIVESYWFMAPSTDKVVSFLPKVRFNILDHLFLRWNELDRKLYQKNFDPYSYFDFHEMFLKKRFADFQNWNNSVHGGQASITSHNLLHAQKLFDKIKGENFGIYHTFYLLTDTLLLSCVLESPLKMIFPRYGWESVHLYTCSHFPGHSFLKVNCSSVELFTDREHLEITKTLIKSGVTSASSESLAQTKNDLLTNFVEMKAKTFGLVGDANR